MTPAPYYSHRIVVILSKQKEVEREKAFLAAWCKHFSEVGIGRRYADLVERARKKGAFLSTKNLHLLTGSKKANRMQTLEGPL